MPGRPTPITRRVTRKCAWNRWRKPHGRKAFLPPCSIARKSAPIRPTFSSTLSLPSLQHKHNLRDLGSAHAQRVREIELAEQALWKTITPAQAKREVDPAQLVGKLVRRGDDGAILRHSGRRICLEDDTNATDEWRVVLEGEQPCSLSSAFGPLLS